MSLIKSLICAPNGAIVRECLINVLRYIIKFLDENTFFFEDFLS
jgi:hypothetical protein